MVDDLDAPYLVINSHPQVLLQHGRLFHQHQGHKLTQLFLTGHPIMHLRLQQHRAQHACRVKGVRMSAWRASCEGCRLD
eukprot:1153935-Pelagomonas_calceolata.AAC.4